MTKGGFKPFHVVLIVALSLGIAYILIPGIKGECKRISGVVTAIYEDGTKDAVFKIAGYKPVFYINRGLEKTFNLNSLLEKLKGKEVSILYADSWTPLGAISECRRISELSTNEGLVYSEFE